jgi:hypothetical protein
MAKLNWQKLATIQAHDRHSKSYNKNESRKDLDKKWLLGAHYGKTMNQLPLQYLLWVSETFEDKNYHKIKADAELIKRHNKLN